MWLSLLASLLKLFNVFAEASAKRGTMDAAQALLIADVIQNSLDRIARARAARDAYLSGRGSRADTKRVLEGLDRSKR